MKTITLPTAEEVVAMVEEQLPQLAEFTTISKKEGKAHAWVYVETPWKPMKETRETLKKIGFRWGSRTKKWYHTCDTPPAQLRRSRRYYYGNKNHKNQDTKAGSTGYQPETNASVDEMERRLFG